MLETTGFLVSGVTKGRVVVGNGSSILMPRGRISVAGNGW